MILAEIKFKKTEELFGKVHTFYGYIKEIETKRFGRYRQIYSEHQNDYDVLHPFSFKTELGLNECFKIMVDLGYCIVETKI